MKIVYPQYGVTVQFEKEKKRIPMKIWDNIQIWYTRLQIAWFDFLAKRDERRGL